MTLPQTMVAVEMSGPGGPDVLRLATTKLPALKDGEVLIEVAAAGVNRPDVLQRTGKYPPPPGAPDTLGLEVAGKVVAVSPGVAWPVVGERVCALVAGGGYAQYAAAPALQCLPITGAFSDIEAAAIPETYFTVWTNVFERGGLKAGEYFMVHGGASGIGTTAIQLAKAFGAHVLATVGSAEKCAAVAKLGADRAVDYKREDFVEAAKAFTGGHGIDLTLDMVGGDYFMRNVEAAAVEGRIVQIAFLRGSKIEVALDPIMRKRLTYTGSTLRPRSVAQKGEIAAALREKVWPLLASGQVRPLIYKTFPLAEAAAAHALMEADTHIGKIVLTVGK
ncbi:MAG: NAD(P)H-quinone oxidoreductase [Rhodospirillales bacterium]|jgi:NADPH2:quinone reductase